jgi:uncharacterized protein
VTVLRSLVLWVTTDCNLRCGYCYARGGDSPEYMSWKVAKRAIDLVARSGEAFKIQFSGGEPLLHLELIEAIVNYCTNLPARFQIQTNATLVTPELAIHLSDLELAVGVSLDGVPEVNDRLRRFPDGSGSTGAAIAGIRSFGSAGMKVGMTCVLSRENVTALPQLVNLASYLGNVYGISIDVLRPVGRAVEEGVLHAWPQEAARAVRLAVEQADGLAAMGGALVRIREIERMRYRLKSNPTGNGYCHFSHAQALMVKPSGEAYPCASLADLPAFRVGHVLDPGFAKRLHARLQSAQALIPLSPACRQCPDLPLCRGGCPARAYATRDCPAEIAAVECRVRKTYLEHVRGEQ